MKVYLDNVIVSGMVRGDLQPPQEMAAVRALAKADEKGQIRVPTSRWSWEEQDRTHDDFGREKLKESRGEIEVVANDHRVLGFWNQEDPRFGTVSTNPIVTEIVDERLFSASRRPGFRMAMRGTSCTLSTTSAIGLSRSTPMICCPTARTWCACAEPRK